MTHDEHMEDKKELEEIRDWKGKRPPDLEIYQRINAVKDLILSNYDLPEIVEYCRKTTPSKQWHVSVRQAYRYIDKAKELINEVIIYPNLEKHLQEQMGKLHLLHKRCMAIQDYKTALAVEKEMNELLGLHSQNVKLEGNIKHNIMPFNLSDAEIKKLEDEIKNG